ncbi:hypothetical protein KGM_203492 [Danaus plexippus plexippus]|uniref:Uncharacterized protein n=1 Tax=Danaus plexippus plexippus TaxID=278856 RepID=A0A212FKN4_DANPL|nr:hypothetical protein KGM_203492 [Danaus plexippus plexippus]
MGKGQRVDANHSVRNKVGRKSTQHYNLSLVQASLNFSTSTFPAS